MEKVSRSEVVSAIAAKGIKNSCPSCSQTGTWIVPSQADDDDNLEVMMMVAPRDIHTGFAFAPMICGHCGFTQFLHLETLLRREV